MASINYAVGNNWGTGFVGNMTVPGGTQGLHGWTIEFDATFDISNIWGAEIVSHVGNHYVIRNLDWNATVPAGGQASFGFQATPAARRPPAWSSMVRPSPRRRHRRPSCRRSRSATPPSPKAIAAPRNSPLRSSSRRPPRDP